MKCFKKIFALIIVGAVGITYTCYSVPVYAWDREDSPKNICEVLMKTTDSGAVQKTNTPMKTEIFKAAQETDSPTETQIPEVVQETEKPIETVTPFTTDKPEESHTFSPIQTRPPVYTQLPINTTTPQSTSAIEETIYPASTETVVKTSSPIKTPSPTFLPEYTLAPDATLKPPFDGEEYCQIIYQLNGGKNHRNNPVKVKKKGESVVLNAPSRAKYTFVGWYIDAKYTHKVTTVGNTSLSFLTVYAKWKKVTVKQVKFSVVKKKGKNSILVKLKRENGVKGFEYVYAKDACFKRKYRLRTQKNPKTLSKLTKKKIYYIKVRAYKLDSTGKKIYGNYSRVKKVKL